MANTVATESKCTRSGYVCSLKELQNAQPVQVRRVFRQGDYFKQTTGGLCKGFIQANIAGFHGSYAKDFVQFCRANDGPLPLLNYYQQGVFSAPGLADDSDIRTDLAAYSVLRYGKYQEVEKDLLQFGDALKDFAFFYTGCSFSFDKVLLDAGIPLVYTENPDLTVSMYTTNVPCYRVGSFEGHMVVSMRPIPRHLIQVAVRATSPLKDVHGAPIHIGDPSYIGIHDLYQPHYGDPPPPLKEDHIPVYWGCGNTIKEVMKSSKLPLTFTMHSDCMYITDVPASEVSAEKSLSDSAVLPEVIEMVQKTFTASLVSDAVHQKIRRIETILKNRSDCNFLVEDELLRTSVCLSHSSSVAMTTSFVNFSNDDDTITRQFYEEANGFIGTIAVATLLQTLGKKVTVLTGPGYLPVLKNTLTSLVETGILQDSITCLQYPPPNSLSSESTAVDFLMNSDNATPRFDHLMSVGFTEGSRELFLAATDLPMLTTSEFRNKSEKVDDGLAKSGSVGTTTYFSAATLHGYGIAAALYLLSKCPVHDRYRRRGVGFSPTDEDINKFKSALPSISREVCILEVLIKCQGGVCDDSNSVAKLLDNRTRTTIGQLLDVL